MKTRKRKDTIGRALANLAGKSLLAVAAFVLVGAVTVNAAPVDMFGGWSEIGDPGNVADTTGNPNPAGAVAYTFSIAKYEVSEDDYSSVMTGTGNGSLLPQRYVDLNWAMQFVNALTTADGGTPLYEDDGTGDFMPRKTRADLIADGEFVYAIPTENEWYKAAYYSLTDNAYYDYANGSNLAPPSSATGDGTGWNHENAVGSPWAVGGSKEEQNGTYDMMGNVWEWQEDIENDRGVLRGGYYSSGSGDLSSSGRATNYAPTSTSGRIGFRVVAVPEPASAVLLVLVGGLAWFVRRIKRV